jgi:hypothetical protein
MDFVKSLRNILESQKKELKQFEEELSSIEKLDLLNEYNSLEQKAKSFESSLESLKGEHAKLKKEYHSLKENLSAEMYSQKLNLLSFSKRRVFKLYKDFELNNFAKLQEIELSAEEKLVKINDSVASYNGAFKNDIESKIIELKKSIHEFKLKQQEQAESFGKDFHDQYDREYSALREQPLSEEQIKKRTANTNIEMKLGKRITNIVGIVFVLIGVVLGLQYASAIFHFSNYVKSGSAFFLGLCFLVCGELMNRKSRSVFSLGITAGGIAILFVVTGISFFLLDLFSMPFAFGLTVLISAAAFLLSLRYKSQTIAVFAYIGAFLPIISAWQDAEITILLGYSFFLNVFMLLFYTRKDWSILKYISFSLHIIGFSVLTFIAAYDLSCSLLIAFAAANYLVYVIVPLLSAWKNAKKISTGSSVILTINTFFSSGLVFILLDNFHYENFFGLTALIMAAFFVGLGFVIYKTMKIAHLLVLFLGTAFVFAVLVIPLQFDAKWITLGWLAEATGLLVIGIMLKNKWYKIGGGIILAFSILCFIFNDLTWPYGVLYIGKASAITFSCIIVFLCSLFKNQKEYMQNYEGRFLSLYKNFVSVICFLYLLLLNDYILTHLHRLDMYNIYSGNFHEIGFVYICFAVSFAHQFIKVLKDKFGIILQIVLIILGIIFCIKLNMESLSTLEMILVIFANAISIILVYIFTNRFINRGKISREAQTIILSIFLLVLILQILISQYDYSFNSMIISIVLVLLSLALVIAGFVKRFAYLRRFGLALNLISLIKFFLFDLYFLERGERIISYFVLGFVLIGISYVYQHFSKKLLKENEHVEA